MNNKLNIEETNKIINNLSFNEIKARSEKDNAEAVEDFKKLKENLLKNTCSYCGNPIAHFSVNKPCFHWLLKPKGFKKRHFPLLFNKYSYHNLEAYLRWVANCDKPFQNINDLKEERTPSKVIETTIRYKNLEWSFSCSKSDYNGHKEKFEGKEPHYHFQMKENNLVIINYNGFHIPFDDYDHFCFAVENGEIDCLEAGHIQGAGMQSLVDLPDEDLINGMRYTDNEDTAQFNTQILITAHEGQTISGEDLADLLKKRDKTGISLAKLAQELENASVQTFISPGKGVPAIAARKSRNNNKTIKI